MSVGDNKSATLRDLLWGEMKSFTLKALRVVPWHMVRIQAFLAVIISLNLGASNQNVKVHFSFVICKNI